jgi:hypothetical protein
MLREAVRLAEVENRAVYVIAGNNEQARSFANRVPKGLGIQFETVQTLPEFDWETLSLPGAHLNCVVLVDHYAIESKFGHILKELHRYDETR